MVAYFVCYLALTTHYVANEMNSPPAPRARRIGAASRFADGRLAAGHVSFSLDELVQATGLSLPAARSQTHRLRPRIVRVSAKDTFFLIVTPEHLSRGAPPVEWWIGDYFRWLARPYYLALLTAAGVHGASPQSIQVTQVMTDRPRRPLTVGRQHIQFFAKRRAEQTSVQLMSNAYAPTRVSTPASTAYDLVRYAPRIGGIGRAWETIRPLLPLIDPAAFRSVLEAEHETSTTQRLGYLLERAGEPRLAKVAAKQLPAKLPPISLAVSGPAAARIPAPRWRVIDNSGEFVP